MIYNDGYETDSNLRFVRCPKCGNEEFSNNAQYCRICGFQAYNECEGYYDQDQCEQITHKNVGNARYCESCGQPTVLLKAKLLKHYTEVQAAMEKQEVEEISFDTDDLPF